MKKYRVNESELFNLQSMDDHLFCILHEMEEKPAGTYTAEQWTEIYEKVEKVRALLDKAYYVGALVDWPTLKAIREIKAERQMIRYATCLAAGDSESEAALAFDL